MIDMSEHSWLRGLLCCPKSPLPLLTPGLVCSSAAPVSDFCWICANVWHHAVVLLMQHGSGPYFVKQVKRGQGQKCTKTGKPGEKCVIFEQVQGTPVVIMLSGDVSGPLVTLCSLDILQRCRRPAAAALQHCSQTADQYSHLGDTWVLTTDSQTAFTTERTIVRSSALIIMSTWTIRADKVTGKCGQMEEFNH